MPEKSSIILSNIFYMLTEAECLRTTRAWDNQNSFLNSINPLMRRMISQGVREGRITSFQKAFQHTSN